MPVDKRHVVDEKTCFISSLDMIPKRSHGHTNFMAQYLLDSFSSVKYIVLPVLTLKKYLF